MHYAHNVCVQVHIHFVKVWRCRPYHYCLRQLLRFQVKGCDRKRRKAVVRAVMPKKTVAEITSPLLHFTLAQGPSSGFPLLWNQCKFWTKREGGVRRSFSESAWGSPKEINIKIIPDSHANSMAGRRRNHWDQAGAHNRGTRCGNVPRSTAQRNACGRRRNHWDQSAIETMLVRINAGLFVEVSVV